MTETRKKSSSSSGRSTKKTTTGRSRQSKKKIEEYRNFTDEIILWGVLAISILLFISNFGIGGTIGNMVSSIFFGIFGLLAYVFPVILVIATFFFASNRGNRVATIKLVAMGILVCSICMFVELLVNGAAAPGPLAVYEYCYANKIGGGVIGGLLAWLIAPNFGLVGAYVINVAVLIICLVLITERSALRGVQKGSKKVYETAKVTNERHREMVEARREEQKLRRIDKKVEGVAIDTRVLPANEKKASDEISELHIETHMELPEIKEENKVALKSGMSVEPEMQTSELERILADSMKTMNATPVVQEKDVHTYSTRVGETTDEMAHAATEEQVATRRRTRQSETEIQSGISDIEKEIDIKTDEVRKYVFPPVSLLKQIAVKQGDSRQHLQDTANKLQQTLKNFGVNVTITNVSCGPAVTRYELQPEMGVKVSKIVNLADDIKLNLAAADIRIEAPIPGKAAVGIEVPNKENVVVSFRELIESPEFKTNESKLSFCVGRDIGGKVVVTDIAKMPHLLIAGATGSGKSVCINTIIMSILYKADPKDVKLIMIDPKVVELSVYNGIPHLMIPVVTDPKKAAGALHWAVAEMTDRYNKFAEAGVRDLKGYNAKIESLDDVPGEDKPQKLPQIVIIVDELADLMMVASNDVEEAICRLAQLARACGIHLIIATQRPSVNVITGLIKANMPSRIAFAVTSGVDSRTILDMNGAEKLLGKGDMLFNPQGVPKPIRIQGAFVSDKEVLDVVSFLKEQNNGMVNYSAEIEAKMNSIETGNTTVAIDGRGDSTSDGRDAYFAEAAKLIIDKEKGSIGMLQRYFKVGFNRAARIMDQLEEAGIVGPEEGTKPRRVLMSPEQFEQFVEEEL